MVNNDKNKGNNVESEKSTKVDEDGWYPGYKENDCVYSKEDYELDILPGKKFIEQYGKIKWMNLEQSQIIPESDVQYYRSQDIFIWNKITKTWSLLDQSKMYRRDVLDIELLFHN